MPEWIGKTIGKVRIERLLARGGMAEVYLGTHLTLARSVAVKVLHSFIEEEPILLERFQREARVVAGLRQPNIVQIFDFDTIDGHPYIVMEYLKGPTLATYLRKLHQRKKRSPHLQVAHLLQGLTAALDYAHMWGVIHRDIKPANILLHNKTDEFPLDKPLPNDVEAVVTDFGLVRVVDATSHTTSGILSGTPMYMSPEQARGDPVDYRTDIYSLGVVLYEMLAGQLPFKADNTLTILHMHIHTMPAPIPGISAKVQAVLDRALAKNPDGRYQTSRELAGDFSHAIGMNVDLGSIKESASVNPLSSQTLVELPMALLPKRVSLPADMLELLSHDNSSIRKLAIQELVALLDGKHAGLARAAQEKLREIAENDDSLTLRRIAAQELSARGLEAGLPHEIQNERLIQEPSKPPGKSWFSQKYFTGVVNKLKAINPLPKLMEWKLSRSQKRMVSGILAIALGIACLASTSRLIANIGSNLTPTPTATIKFTQFATFTVTITPSASGTISPTFTRTRTSTPTLTLTPTSTRTLIPLKPTRRPRDPTPINGPPPIP